MLPIHRINSFAALALIVLSLLESRGTFEPSLQKIPLALGLLLLVLTPLLRAGQKMALNLALLLNAVALAAILFSLQSTLQHGHWWDKTRLLLMLTATVWSTWHMMKAWRSKP
jgi:hypothetical protein